MSVHSSTVRQSRGDVLAFVGIDKADRVTRHVSLLGDGTLQVTVTRRLRPQWVRLVSSALTFVTGVVLMASVVLEVIPGLGVVYVLLLTLSLVAMVYAVVSGVRQFVRSSDFRVGTALSAREVAQLSCTTREVAPRVAALLAALADAVRESKIARSKVASLPMPGHWSEAASAQKAQADADAKQREAEVSVRAYLAEAHSL